MTWLITGDSITHGALHTSISGDMAASIVKDFACRVKSCDKTARCLARIALQTPPGDVARRKFLRAECERVFVAAGAQIGGIASPVALKAGWNKILIKAPRAAPAWKWSFTCVPVAIVNGVPHEVADLKFSLTPDAA